MSFWAWLAHILITGVSLIAIGCALALAAMVLITVLTTFIKGGSLSSTKPMPMPKPKLKHYTDRMYNKPKHRN